MIRRQLSFGVCSLFAGISVLLAVRYLNNSADKLVLLGLNSTATANENTHNNQSLVDSPLPRHETGFIPKIVHQEWKSKQLTPNFKAWREECIRLNPDWEFRLWTDEENQKLVEEHYPELFELYNGYNEPIRRIDMIRFLYLHRFGGVYMDLDMLCLKPFGDYFDQYYDDYIVVNEYRNKVSLANAFMAAPPGHPLFQDIFRELPRHKDEQYVFDATGGPFLQKYVLPQTSAHWVQLNMTLFYGQEWTQGVNSGWTRYNMCESVADCKRQYPHTYTVSMWTGVWKSGDDSKRKWKGNVTEGRRR